jgi:hypothetical protein
MAKPNLRKTADLLEQVMTRGLQPEQLAKQLPRDAMMQSPQYPGADPLLDLPLMEGQIQGADVDNILREAVKNLKSNEVLILRGDR